MKPFLSWAGSKYSVINDVIRYLPEGERLVDVFAGSGSIFMNAGFEKNLVADINNDLIQLFRDVAGDAESVINIASALFEHKNNASDYYDVRKDFNSNPDVYISALKSAQFLFLNKSTFNGLFRRNLRGEFNSPWGQRKSIYLPADEMREFSSIASKCDFICAPYEVTIGKCGLGDVVVCDPPYQPLPGDDGFTSYSGAVWDMTDQEMLVNSMLLAHDDGAKLVLMNSGAPVIKELYQDNGFDIHQLPTRRSIGKARFVANDVIAVKL